MKPLSEETRKFLAPIALEPSDRLRLSIDRDCKHFHAELLKLSASGMNFPPSNASSRTFVQRVPERKELDKKNHFSFAATDFTTTIISAVWKQNQIDMTDEARVVYSYLEASAKAADQVADLQADYKLNGQIPAHDLEIHPELPLSPYQVAATLCSLHNEGYGLFMEPGTGKTAITISRICTEARDLGKREAALKRKKSVDEIEARYQADAAVAHEEVQAELEKQLASKEAKLLQAANKRFELWHTKFEYHGLTSNLVARAAQIAREAEDWLARRKAEISIEMSVLRRAARAEADAAIGRRLETLRTAADVEIARLVAPQVGKRTYKVLVVCPLNVRMNWQSEIERFATVKGKVTVARGGKMERYKAMIEALDCEEDELFTVYVCNYDVMVNDLAMLQAVNWDLAVLDESHYCKWPDTDRSKACLKLRDSCRQRMVLTGTPVCNTPLDLYMQFEFMREGASGFMSWRNFRSFYGVFETSSAGYEKLVSVQNLPFLKERCARMAYQMSLKEALPDLPEKTYDVIEVEMTAEQTKAYNKLKHELALEIEHESRKKSLVINNILTKLLRLAQITSGFVKWMAQVDFDGKVEFPAEVEFFDPNPKLEELVDVLKAKSPLDKTLIWCSFVPDIRVIETRLRAEGMDCVTFYGATNERERKIAEDRYNEDPNCRWLIGNPAAGGTGLNLVGYPVGRPHLAETNTTHEIYYSTDWSSVKRTQSEARGHRRGTRVTVRVSDLCVPQTIDEEIRKRVFMKRVSAADIADVKQILASVLDLRIDL